MMKNILIIDDNEDILGIFKQLLVEEGFSVSTAKNGITGIELFRKESFDLVITDIHMPEISGLDVAENIRIIITVYEPDPEIWYDDLKTRR